MPSGYEKSPDYGGKPPDWKSNLGAFAVFIAVGAVLLLLNYPSKPNCEAVGPSEVRTTEIDGRTVNTMSLENIKPGECVTIQP
ncbi:MAG: hypothetical protein CTY31_05045 [Hyphomicrobium sp.]|nr:MAG: hypothetical protein CTY31_05045 [Hyphomicrobium sp.]